MCDAAVSLRQNDDESEVAIIHSVCVCVNAEKEDRQLRAKGQPYVIEFIRNSAERALSCVRYSRVVCVARAFTRVRERERQARLSSATRTGAFTVKQLAPI